MQLTIDFLYHLFILLLPQEFYLFSFIFLTIVLLIRIFKEVFKL